MYITTHEQKGITLIEIMVALALSLVILAGVMHIFLNNKQTYRVQEAFARIQENGRFAMQFLAKDLRMAGYVGCGGKISDVHNIADHVAPKGPDEVSAFTSTGLEGFEYSSLPIVLSDSVTLTTADVYNNPGKDSPDIIRIKRAAATGARLWGNLDPIKAAIQLDGATAKGLFHENDYLFISDCEKADIFVATTVSDSDHPITIAHASDENTTNFLSKSYKNDAEIYRFINSTYYIGINAANQPSLFRRSLINGGNLSNEELVEGVEDLQILYGEDTDGDSIPNLFVDANMVTDWNNIVAARIEIQVRSIEDNLARNVTVYGDRKLRRTFTTSIAIRNRTT